MWRRLEVVLEYGTAPFEGEVEEAEARAQAAREFEAVLALV